ncbi:cyclase family protein [Brachyspira sp. G79]|uniref:cyclase family protein n=1 Tax=Brachyspira sp. G79 TaxID=1358104 RepID=UPI000BBCB379|nr:cyclase family protein [Brachyspira sp. G79]PCG20622.1 cyclase [Brachyspira sp. G79]
MIIDLSFSIYNNMPHYPNDIDVKVENCNYEYFNITNINMCVHSGTHIDTPLHCINNKPSAENIDLSYFIGSAYCIDIKADKENKINFPYNFDFETIKGYDILLINTSWHKNINTKNYYKNFPYLSESFANQLLNLKIKTIGIDSPSVDNINNNLIHNILFSHDICIIEGLSNLDKVSNKEFFFSAAPLKIENAEGSPVRAYAII